MARTDYYDDPAAPRPNSLVVAASVVLPDETGRILLLQRMDSGNWALPGGGMELGESLPQCAVREVLEETGLDIAVTGLVGIYTDPRHVIGYSDGEVRQQFNVCFRGQILGGVLTRSDESADLRFIDLDEIDQLPTHPTQRLRIEHYRIGDNIPHLG